MDVLCTTASGWLEPRWDMDCFKLTRTTTAQNGLYERDDPPQKYILVYGGGGLLAAEKKLEPQYFGSGNIVHIQ